MRRTRIGVIAPDRKTATSVLANIQQVVKSDDLRLHPIFRRLVDQDRLEEMGARSQAR